MSDEMMEFEAARKALEKYNKAVITVVHGAGEIDLPFARIAKSVLDRHQQVLNDLYYAEIHIQHGDADTLRALIRKVQERLTDKSANDVAHPRREAEGGAK